MRLFASALLLALAATASAQPANWALPASGSTVSLSAERPLLKDNVSRYDLGPLSSAWLFSTTQAIGPVRLVGELPFAYGSAEDTSFLNGGEVDGFALGNVQVGAEADLLVAPVTVGGYVRIPTATVEDAGNAIAQSIGLLSDAERVGLYIEDLVTVSAMVEARPSVLAVPGLSFRLRATPQLLIPTDGRAFNDDFEVVIGYAAQAFFSTGVARIGGGLSGAGIVTQDTDDPVEMSAGIMADAGLGPVRVGVTGRLPVVGLTLTYGVD